MRSDIVVGRRLLDFETKQTGTIRYIGSITNREGEWVGIEWDNPNFSQPEDAECMNYFSCSKLIINGKISAASSCTLVPIDAAKSMCLGTSFIKALLKKYTASVAGDDPLTISKNKLVEIVGSDEAESYFKNIFALNFIDLYGYPVSDIGYNGTDNQLLVFSKLEHFSFACNLVNSFEIILKLLSLMPRLKNFICSHCRFTRGHLFRQFNGKLGDTIDCSSNSNNTVCSDLINVAVPWISNPEVMKFPSVVELTLADSGIELVDFYLISCMFQNLNSLDVSYNPQLADDFSEYYIDMYLNQIHSPNLNIDPTVTTIKPFTFSYLKRFSFHHNQLTCWKKALLFPITICPNLEELILSSNKLSDHIADLSLYEHQLKGIKELIIDNNEIQNWSTMGWLSLSLPCLENIKVQGNPLLEISSFKLANTYGTATHPGADLNLNENINNSQDKIDYKLNQSRADISHQIIISIFPQLTHLNGSAITEEERKNAELYYLLLCRQDLPIIKMINCSKHYDRLKDKYSDYSLLNTECNPSFEKTPMSTQVQLHLMPNCETAFSYQDVKISVNLNLKLLELKLLCKKHFNVCPSKQKLTALLPNYKKTGFPLLLENDMFTLDTYGIENGTTILVGDE